ncbi:MAG: hypothetical protein E8D42_06755 [Nitrospira sp.]|nr:MAG: hypothetical protein E8D42_06755 [Nitrospira sp.]
MSRVVTFLLCLFTINFHLSITDAHGLTFPCNPSETVGAILAVTGEFKFGDDGLFKQALRSCRERYKAIDRIEFKSGGGNVKAAFGIAEEIAKHGFRTHVSAGSYCISACTLAFLGGIRRTIDPNGSYEVHGFSSHQYNRAGEDSTYSANARNGFTPFNMSLLLSLKTIHAMMGAMQNSVVLNVMKASLVPFQFEIKGDTISRGWPRSVQVESINRYVDAMNTPEMSDLVMTLAEMRSEESTEIERSGAKIVVDYVKFLLKQGVSLDFLDHMFEPTINTVDKMSPQTLRALSVVTE